MVVVVRSVLRPARHSCSGRQAVGRYGPRVPAVAVLRDPRTGRVVDPDQAKALREAGRPLEIVEQGPYEVAPHVHPGDDGVPRRLEVLFQVPDPVGVVYRTVWAHVVVLGGAIF